MAENVKHEQLIHRMSRFLGLPESSIQQMIQDVPAEDLDKLAALPDENFLRESTRIINAAQRAARRGGAEAEALPPMAAVPVGEDDDDAPVAEAVLTPDAAELPQSFRTRAKKVAGMDRGTAVFLIGAGVVAIAVVVILGYLVLNLLQSPSRPETEEVEQLLPDMIAAPTTPTQPGPEPGTGEAPVPEPAPLAPPTVFAWEIGTPLELHSEYPDMFGETATGCTVEMWVRFAPTTAIRQFVLVGTAAEPVFSIGVIPAEDGSQRLAFSCPPAASRPAVTMPPVPEVWHHIAGVYLPDEAKLRLFLNGRPVAESACFSQAVALNPAGLAIRANLPAATGNIRVGALRLSTSPLYREEFVPTPELTPADTTVSLIVPQRREMAQPEEAAPAPEADGEDAAEGGDAGFGEALPEPTVVMFLADRVRGLELPLPGGTIVPAPALATWKRPPPVTDPLAFANVTDPDAAVTDPEPQPSPDLTTDPQPGVTIEPEPAPTPGPDLTLDPDPTDEPDTEPAVVTTPPIDPAPDPDTAAGQPEAAAADDDSMPFPEQIVAAIEEKYGRKWLEEQLGADYRKRIYEEWAAMSIDQRRRYLDSLVGSNGGRP